MKKSLFCCILLINLLTTGRADTINIQLTYPMTISFESYCQSLGYDTFVLYKPVEIPTITYWRVNNEIFPGNDSLIFRPSSSGSYEVMCIWPNDGVMVYILLFTSPPSHPEFTILEGGIFNQNKDTIFRQGSYALVDVTSVPEALYSRWNGPNGFIPTDNPVFLTTLGMYYHEIGNACGITRDTFYLVSSNSILPQGNLKKQIFVYPNPSSGIFHVEGYEVSKISVFDCLGRMLFVSSTKEIDLNSYGSGMYYARIIQNDINYQFTLIVE